MPKFLSVKTFKKLTAFTLIASLLLNPIAHATSSYLEIDSQESDATDRLHTMMPLSNIRDISHIEIDPDEQRVRVYRDRETAEDNLDPETSPQSPRESVLEMSRDNVYNLPWQLGQEGLNSFLSQHTAWLTPLGEDDYRLEFTGRLLGGMWGATHQMIVAATATIMAAGHMRVVVTTGV